jgi:hypothetical protein
MVPAALIVRTNIMSMWMTKPSVNFVVPRLMARVALTVQPKNTGTETAQNADGAAALRPGQGALIVRQKPTNISISNQDTVMRACLP